MNILFRKYPPIILLALLLFPALSWAAPAGTFTNVEGRVDILRVSATRVVAVKVGDPVDIGDAIRTKRNSKAEIQFRDESVIQLAPETRITINEYSFRPDDSRDRTLIGLLRGKLRAMVSKLKTAVIPVSHTDSSFNIKTPTAIAGVKGTDFIVYYDRGVTGIIFLDGYGFVFNPDRPDRVVPIKGGQATYVPSGSEPPLDAHPVSDAFVAPHLRDTTIALTQASAEGGTEGLLGTAPRGAETAASPPQGVDMAMKSAAPAATPEVRPVDKPVVEPVPAAEPDRSHLDISVNVTAPNTSYGALTAGDSSFPAYGTGLTGGGTPVVIDTYGGAVGHTAGGTTPIIPPVTETHADLLGTPVTVNVRIP